MDYVVNLLPIQKSLFNSPKTIAGIYAGRGTGKSVILSWMIVFSILKGEKSLAFSQNYKSLSQNLFEEIIKRFEDLKLTPEYNKSTMTIKYKKGLVYGFSYENVDACRGQTDCHNLFCDEIALAPTNLLSVTAPCLRGQGIIPKIRFASSPRAGSYWNNEIKKHIQLKDWDIFTGTMFENKFLSEESIQMAKEAITDSIMIRQELYGEILDDVIENGIVSITDFNFSHSLGTNNVYIAGIDFARYGNDSTVITVRNDYEIIEQIKLNKADTETICSTFRKLDMIYKFKDVYLDATGGFHIGFYDSMKVSHNNLHEINFGAKPTNPMDSNIRTSMYFNLASSIQNGFFISPNKFQDTIDELKSTSYIINNNGKRALVPKESIKSILGHSPDSADSLALTFALENNNPKNYVDEYRTNELTNILFR